jgi:predicted outer membrane protein
MTGLQLKKALVEVIQAAMGDYYPTLEYTQELTYLDMDELRELNNTAYNFDPKKLYQALQTEQDEPELIAEAYKHLQIANREAETDEELAEAQANFLAECVDGLRMTEYELMDLYEE